MNARNATLWAVPLCYVTAALLAFAHPSLRPLWWLQALLVFMVVVSWFDFLRDRRSELLPSHASTNLLAALLVVVMLALQVVP
ncbi:hypothetical protein [Deinococcus yavapaiensis]|uniref:hypothetical protein n=1 Tax=Deinococcus yavapaiensis TaxID=309889 RepID=UPI0011B4A824|nr:hypothetical protein [Deinococcus yavapaiensis]